MRFLLLSGIHKTVLVLGVDATRAILPLDSKSAAYVSLVVLASETCSGPWDST